MANQRTVRSAIAQDGARDVPDISGSQRRLAFARSELFEDPALSGLFALLREARDRDSRIELSRFARERLRAAFPAGTGKQGEVELVNGLCVTVDVGDSFGAEFAVGHLNESDLLDAVTANIPDGAKIVDVGANFGLYALHSAWAAGPASRVVAFEPLPSAGRLLLHNVDANALAGQITFVASAVGAKRSKANFYIAEDGAFSGLHDTKRSRLAETIEVPVVSLDASPEVTKLGAVDFLKVDVEGHEGGVLAGARKLMERSERLLAVLEFSHKNLTETGRSQIIAALQACLESGFRIWLHDDHGVRAAGNIADELAGDVSATLILAARGCSWAEGLIASLEAISEARARGDLAHGLQPLITAVREARHVSTQAEAMSQRFASGAPAQQAMQEIAHLLGEQQAKIKSMSGRIEGLESHAEALQTKLDERLQSHHALSTQGAEQQAALKAMLEKKAGELAANLERAERLSGQLDVFRKAAEAQNEKLMARTKVMESAQAAAVQLRAELAEANARISQLEAELVSERESTLSAAAAFNEEMAAASEKVSQLEADLAAQTDELEARRTAIRQLQQREALLRLGKHKF